MKMKKIFFLLLITCSLFTLFSCNLGGGGDNGGEDDDPVEITTPYTDELKLEASYSDYASKDFLVDGYGIATLKTSTDGDTSTFRTKNGTDIIVRYQGINTPESTFRIDPWGFAASRFTKAKLEAADKIVLVSDTGHATTDSTGNRYLAWVWLIDASGDSRLLNLEIIENCLSGAKLSGIQKYSETLTDAQSNAMKLNIRVYNALDKDPEYDYNKTGVDITIKELREIYSTEESITNETGKGTKVKIHGIVVQLQGYSAYILEEDESTDTWYGIYVYCGFSANTKLQIGREVTVEGNIGYYNGTVQVTGVNSETTTIVSVDNQLKLPDPKVVTKQDFINKDVSILGTFVTLKNVVVSDGYDSTTNSAFTVQVKGASDNYEMQFYVPDDVNLKETPQSASLESWVYFENKSLDSITGIMGVFNGRYQILLFSLDQVDYAD